MLHVRDAWRDEGADDGLSFTVRRNTSVNRIGKGKNTVALPLSPSWAYTGEPFLPPFSTRRAPTRHNGPAHLRIFFHFFSYFSFFPDFLFIFPFYFFSFYIFSFHSGFFISFLFLCFLFIFYFLFSVLYFFLFFSFFFSVSIIFFQILILSIFKFRLDFEFF